MNICVKLSDNPHISMILCVIVSSLIAGILVFIIVVLLTVTTGSSSSGSGHTSGSLFAPRPPPTAPPSLSPAPPETLPKRLVLRNTTEMLISFGGLTSSGQILNSVDVWDPALGGNWSSGVLPPLSPDRRAAAVVVVHKYSILITGGYSSRTRQGLRNFELLSLNRYRENLFWESLPNMLMDHFHHCSLVLDDWIYAIGSNVWAERFNLKHMTGKWENIASLPRQRFGAACAAHEGKLWVVGGGADLHPGPYTAYYYTPADNIWTESQTVQAGSKSRKFFSLIQTPESWYAIGGQKTEETFDIIRPPTSNGTHWFLHIEESINDQVLPEGVHDAGGVYDSELNAIYLVGGYNDKHRASGAVQIYNLSTKAWNLIEDSKLFPGREENCVITATLPKYWINRPAN